MLFGWRRAIPEPRVEYPPFPVPEPFDLACVGSSLSGYYAITLDAVRHLQAARRVFLYALNDAHLAFLRQFNSATIDLNQTLYVDGNVCEDAYQNIIDLVLTEARAGGVAYVSQGSPAFQTYTALELVRRVRAEGLVARILPGVSSFECLITAIGIAEPIDEFQLHTCRAVAAGEVRLDARTPCLLFNVSVYSASVVNMHGSRMRRECLEMLAAAIAAIYPAAHPVSLLHLDPSGSISAVASTISRLDRDLFEARSGVTLYISAVG